MAAASSSPTSATTAPMCASPTARSSACAAAAARCTAAARSASAARRTIPTSACVALRGPALRGTMPPPAGRRLAADPDLMRLLYVDDDRVNALLFEQTCRLAGDLDAAVRRHRRRGAGAASRAAPRPAGDRPAPAGHRRLRPAAALRAALGAPALPAVLCTADSTGRRGAAPPRRPASCRLLDQAGDAPMPGPLRRWPRLARAAA